ncbi:MAG: hypothetical protein AABX55_01090 [Nanoarchaeota archaeon]
MTESFSKGFSINLIIEDLVHLEQFRTRNIVEDKRKDSYQEIINLCIKNKMTDYHLLQPLVELRDGKTVPKVTLRYLIEELGTLSQKYLTRLKENLYPDSCW